MNTKDFLYFQALAHLHSFTKVAKEFQVSQPSISYAVKRLEKQFNCELIQHDPSHRTFHLTTQGEMLLKRIDTILPEIQAAKNEIAHSFSHKTSIGFPPMIMDYLVRTTSFLSEPANILEGIHPVQDGSLELLTMVKNNELEASFIGSLTPLEDDDLEIKPLFQSELEILLSKTHPLASRTSLSFSDIQEEDMLILDDHFVHEQAFEQLNQKYHHASKPFFQSDDITLIKQLIRKNVGISLLAPITLAADEKDIISIPLQARDRLSFYVYIVHRKNNQLDAATLKWIDSLDVLS